MTEPLETSRGATPAPDWWALADSSLVAFLRMLADDPTPDAVAESLANGPLAPFGPTLVALGFIDTDRQVLLTMQGAHGVDVNLRRTYAAIPLDADIPATVCYRTNTVITSPAARMAHDYPLTAKFAQRELPSDATIWVFPLRYRSAVIAVLGLELSSPAAEQGAVRSAVAALSGPLATWAALRIHAEAPSHASWAQREPRSLSFTDRQRRIIALVRAGLTNAQIAEEVGYSLATVKAELARMCALLGAADRHDLATRAARAGL
jgi:DNA-binding CsgD family transcriptional regulator